MNQRQLADSVGISASMLSLVESGRREPTIRLLRDIARELEIPAAVLLVGALTDDPADFKLLSAKEAEKVRTLADQLLSAGQHSILLRRLQRAREQQSA